MSLKEKAQWEAQVPLINQRPALRREIGSARLTPFLVTRRQLVELFGSPSLVHQLIGHGWVDVVRLGKPGREALYDYPSAERARERLMAGEYPQAQSQGGGRE